MRAPAWPVPDALAHHYSGRGIALGATRGDTLVALLYIRDLVPDFDDEIESAEGVLDNPTVLAAARALEADFGHVRVGMASCWEFCEL